MDFLPQIQELLSMGWPALVTIAIVFLWRHSVAMQAKMFDEYRQLQNEYTSTLRELAGLRSTSSMLPSTPRVPMTSLHGGEGD